MAYFVILDGDGTYGAGDRCLPVIPLSISTPIYELVGDPSGSKLLEA